MPREALRKPPLCEEVPQEAGQSRDHRGARSRMRTRPFGGLPGDDPGIHPRPESHNINYNSYAVDTGVAVDFTAEKVRLYPPESGVPCVVRSREVPEVRPLAAGMLSALGYRGYSCMEFKKDPRDGRYKLLEINGRYNRSIALSLGCGLNFPRLDYEYLTSGRLPSGTGTSRQQMYWIDVTRDLLSWIPYLRVRGREAGLAFRSLFPAARVFRLLPGRRAAVPAQTMDPRGARGTDSGSCPESGRRSTSMTSDATNRAIELEERRLKEADERGVSYLVHERHRAFPRAFESRQHRKIIDLSAGTGLVAERIRDGYPATLVCNELSPTCLKRLAERGFLTVSIDLDDSSRDYPLEPAAFDAAICLATIEHLLNVEHLLTQAARILADGGFLYLSAPNYSGLAYLLPFLLSGRTFHDPLGKESRYEFFAHVRYFTYRTMRELVESFGFSLDTVYLPLPESSSKFQALRRRSPLRAALVRSGMGCLYTLCSPRWAAEPILCFRKGASTAKRVRKVVF